MSAHPARPDLYISADVETDGPVPGPYSLLSFGLSAVGRYDGWTFEQWDVREKTFYAELKPISEDFQAEALQVNGLDRDRLLATGRSPGEVMTEAAAWVRSMCPECRPVLVAYPVAFDWAFLYWYFERFAPEGSPFGHSSCLDIRTLYQAVAGTVFDRSGKTAMPDFLRPNSPHTHNALDDAIEQGELFANLLSWSMRRREKVGSPQEPQNFGPSWLTPHIAPIA
ncbi:MAG TPA: exonuclease domain-containing protein [Solirubrobacterales bacterium]